MNEILRLYLKKTQYYHKNNCRLRQIATKAKLKKIVTKGVALHNFKTNSGPRFVSQHLSEEKSVDVPEVDQVAALMKVDSGLKMLIEVI